MSRDHSLSPLARFGSNAWAAQRLGMSKDLFLSKRAELEAEGFPRRDAVVGLYHKASVDRWIERRATIAGRDSMEASTSIKEPSYDRL